MTFENLASQAPENDWILLAILMTQWYLGFTKKNHGGEGCQFGSTGLVLLKKGATLQGFPGYFQVVFVLSKKAL